jgi:hypothetical protein
MKVNRFSPLTKPDERYETSYWAWSIVSFLVV